MVVACLLTVAVTQTVKYPMIMYSDVAFEKTTENSGAVHTPDVIRKLKEAMSAGKASNLLLIVKDGFSSHELVKNVKKFDNLK